MFLSSAAAERLQASRTWLDPGLAGFVHDAYERLDVQVASREAPHTGAQDALRSFKCRLLRNGSRILAIPLYV